MPEEVKEKKGTFFKKAGAMVKKYAPLLGSALLKSTPAGGIFDIIASITGQQDEDGVLKVLENPTPEMVASLKKAQLDHETQLRKMLLDHEGLKVEELRVQLQDTDSARQREANIVAATGKRDPIQAGLTITVCLIAISVTVLVLVKGIDDISNASFLVIGAAIANLTQVLNYYFGSSQGSRLKDASKMNNDLMSIRK